MSLGSFGFAWVQSCAHRRHLDHSGSFGFTRTRIGVVGFIRVREGSLWTAWGPTGSFGFARVHEVTPSGLRGSLEITRARLEVSGFILVRECSFGGGGGV